MYLGRLLAVFCAISFSFLSAENFVSYWEKQAEEIDWFQKWTKTMTGEVPDVRWFEDGKLNISYNLLDRHLATKANKIALIALNEIGQKRVVSYRALYEEVNKLANVMIKLGVRKGDRVAIYMPMVPEAIASMIACTRIGAVHTVIFGGVGAISVKDRIIDCEAKLLITADGSYRSGKKIPYKSTLDTVLEECPTIEKTIVLRNTGNDLSLKPNRDYWYHDLMKDSPVYCTPEKMGAEDPLFILYTSGTTGKPKGIYHTTGGYLVGVATTFKSVFDIKPSDIFWCTADIGWITGHSYVVYGPMALATTQVIYEGSFDYPKKNHFSKIIDENKVSIFYTAPTLIRMFMQWGKECLENSSLDSLRLLGTIGEPINPEAWHWFNSYIGHEKCPIMDTWFQTETGSLVISPLPGVTRLKPGSVTKALPGYSVAVLDEEGNQATKGLLAVLKPYPSMMRGIYKDHDRYVKTYWSKWGGKYYYAGDAAICDEDGYIWIGGRSDEVLKVAGHRIGTAEVENAIIEHKDVAESAVIGAKDEIKGQKIIAFVVLKKESILKPQLENEIKETVVKNLGSYARPGKIIFVNNLPKTRSGKILRRILKNLTEGEPVGNTSTLHDPSILSELEQVCGELNKELYPESFKVDASLVSAKPQLKAKSKKVVHRSSKTLLQELTPHLQSHLEETNYDRVHLVEQFLDYYLSQKSKRPNLSPIQALAEFKPDISVKPYRGSSCYGLTEDMFERIPKKFKPYRVAASLPEKFQQKAWPKLCHTAVVIHFSNPRDENDEGFILFDPNFDIEVPIVVKKDGKAFVADMKDKGKWQYTLHGKEIHCKEYGLNEPKDVKPMMIYYTDEYLNATQVAVKSMIATDRRISLLSRDRMGRHLAHINIQLDKKNVSSSINYEKQPLIDFDVFLNGGGFSEDFAKQLYYDAKTLNALITKIIRNAPVLDQLSKEYVDLIQNCERKQDFTL